MTSRLCSRLLPFAALFGLACATAISIPAIYTRGTPYDIGYAVGSTLQARLQSFLNAYTPMEQMLLPFYNSSDGRPVVEAFIQANSAQFPEMFEELHGLADGSGVDFLKIVLLNLREELFLIMQNTSLTRLTVPSCSDVLVHHPDRAFFGHNEDGDLTIAAGAFIHHSVPSAPDQVPYTAYNYPGLLAGNAFTITANGLAISVNALFPSNISVGSLARQFLTRHVLGATDVEDAINRVTKTGPCASGFSINIGSVVTKELVNIEMSPGFNKASVLRVTNYSYHFNQYLRLTDVPHFEDPSSDHRLARIQQIPPPQTPQELLAILGDTADKAYPIYRNGAAPDLDADTMASALFDLDAGRMDLYVLENPSSAPGPLMSFPIVFQGAGKGRV